MEKGKANYHMSDTHTIKLLNSSFRHPPVKVNLVQQKSCCTERKLCECYYELQMQGAKVYPKPCLLLFKVTLKYSLVFLYLVSPHTHRERLVQ